MRIRSQLIAFLAGSVALGMAATAVLLTAAHREDAAGEAQARAQVTAHEVAGLLTLTQEYARYGEPRAAEQWHQRHRTIAAALGSEQLQQADSPAIAELKAAVIALPPLFSRLEGLPHSGDDFFERRKAALLDQLLTSTQAMSDYAYQWFEEASAARSDVEREFRAITVGAAAAMMLVIVAFAALVQKRVLAPLNGLERAAAAVREGDLTLRLASAAADEFGDLSRQFDAMLGALAESRARIVRSEGQLRAITDNIPAMVSYISRDYRFEFVNGKHREWMGLDPAAMVGRSLADALEPRFYGPVRANAEQAIRGERFQWEGQMPTTSGAAFFFSEYIPDVAADGSVRGCYVLTIDITERRRAELQMAQSEQRLIDLMNNIPAMAGYFDMEERCLYANDTGLRSLGIARADVPGLSLRDALGESNYAQHEPYVREALQGRRARLEGKTPFHGRAAFFQAHLIPDRVDGGAQRGFYVMTFDITALKEAQIQQSRVESRLRAITDNLPVLITYIDRDERYGFVNQTMQDWLGISPSAAVGQKMVDIVPEAYYAQRQEPLRRALRGERVNFEAVTETSGTTRCLQTVYVPDIQPDGSVSGVYTLSTDVTAMKVVERQLSVLVRSDVLTGLPNRYQFNEALPMALARASRTGTAVALMFLDVDHFKSINDTLGHAAGDAVLREFAQRLRHSVRSTDSVARLAGDEFVVTLEGLHNDAEAQAVAQKILLQMRQPFEAEGQRLMVTTSIGVAFHGPKSPPTTPHQLLAQADEALYAAKLAGRNTFRATSPALLETEGMR